MFLFEIAKAISQLHKENKEAKTNSENTFVDSFVFRVYNGGIRRVRFHNMDLRGSSPNFVVYVLILINYKEQGITPT